MTVDSKRTVFKLVKTSAKKPDEWAQIDFKDLVQDDVFMIKEPTGENVEYKHSKKLIAVGNVFVASWHPESGNVYGIDVEAYLL